MGDGGLISVNSENLKNRIIASEENNHKTASVVMCSDATIEYAKLCVKVQNLLQ